MSELCNLRFEDAHIEEGYLKVMGKGAKERIVPIGTRIQKLLWRYVFHFRPDSETEAENCLFLNMEGKSLTSDAIKHLLKRMGNIGGVPRLHPHLCRHSFATNYLLYECVIEASL